MTRVFATTVLSAVFLASNASASTDTSNYFVTAEALDYNNEAVAKLLTNVNSLRTPGEAYAVFDWDNTCMFGDVSATSMFYQVDNLNFRISPEEFETIFALGYNASSSDTCFPNGTSSVIGQGVNGTDVTLVAALDDTVKDYKVLYDAYIAPTYNLTNGSVASATLDDIKETAEFFNFRAKLGYLLYALEIMGGGNEYSECSLTNAMIVYPRLLVGMTGGLAVEGSYSKGLRVFSGQEATMRALREAGIEVVRRPSSLRRRLVTSSDWDSWFHTRMYHKGAAPIYASGDSDGDCQMLNTVRDGIVDTNNRLMANSTCIYGFYEKACLYFGTTEPITNNAYLLQGQDKSVGTWITSGFTTRDGVTYSSGVATNDGCAAYKFLDVL
ncbi:hypothetical protein PHYPSEUDO_013210 [Phytophthora pseudosyringae]|uniref:Uncharacterized protein n=1 Tax=Phytophthora pseudosyringae TaxID=221518 RepID=A0A8T1V8Y2_9STRA|nr:hypothetical protein PHYPSEUDO_013210 [Phytophthora pseudosyringae]